MSGRCSIYSNSGKNGQQGTPNSFHSQTSSKITQLLNLWLACLCLRIAQCTVTLPACQSLSLHVFSLQGQSRISRNDGVLIGCEVPSAATLPSTAFPGCLTCNQLGSCLTRACDQATVDENLAQYSHYRRKYPARECTAAVWISNMAHDILMLWWEQRKLL